MEKHEVLLRGFLRSAALMLLYSCIITDRMLPSMNHVKPLWFLLGQWVGHILFGAMQRRFQLCNHLHAMKRTDPRLSQSIKSPFHQEERLQEWTVFWSAAASYLCLLISQMGVQFSPDDF